jgi:hypothetical protein
MINIWHALGWVTTCHSSLVFPRSGRSAKYHGFDKVVSMVEADLIERSIYDSLISLSSPPEHPATEHNQQLRCWQELRFLNQLRSTSLTPELQCNKCIAQSGMLMNLLYDLHWFPFPAFVSDQHAHF